MKNTATILQNVIGRIPGTREHRTRPEPSIYGPDPGDASVEHYYFMLQEEIAQGILHLRAYPNEGYLPKARCIAQAIFPHRRAMRAILTLALAAAGAGRRPPEDRGQHRSRRHR